MQITFFLVFNNVFLIHPLCEFPVGPAGECIMEVIATWTGPMLDYPFHSVRTCETSRNNPYFPSHASVRTKAYTHDLAWYGPRKQVFGNIRVRDYPP